ncbi:MAG: cytidine deaminase [Nitrospirota bacterium]
MNIEFLIKEAEKSMVNALTGLSQFRVGAAIVCKNRNIYTGCNIESSTSLGICAERVAILKALSEGERDFEVIAIVSSSSDYCFPCGACRQILWEYAPDIEVVVVNKTGKHISKGIKELFPLPFDRNNIIKNR